MAARAAARLVAKPTLSFSIDFITQPAVMGYTEKLSNAMSELLLLLEPVFFTSGLVIFILGLLAYTLTKKHGAFHTWGRRLTILGTGFIIIGYDIGWLVSLIKYAIGT
jgi:hypothetical protein